MASGLVFHTFLFQLLEPFISCKDYISLARSNRYHWNHCKTKQVIFKKFKKEVIKRLEKYETQTFKIPEFIEKCQSDHIILTGSFALCVFNGEQYNQDIDFFYNTKNVIDLQMEKDVNSSINNGLYGTMPCYIKNISQFFCNSDLPRFQFIQVEFNKTLYVKRLYDRFFFNNLDEKKNDEYQKKEQNEELRNISGVVMNSFDLDFCKFVFDFKCLEVFDINSLLYKTSIFRISNECLSNDVYAPQILQKAVERIEKYTQRGFNILNQDLIKEVTSGKKHPDSLKQYCINQKIKRNKRKHKD